MSTPENLSATALAARMRAGDLSPVRVVEDHIQRVERVAPALNALAADRFEAARQEAAEAHQRIQAAAAGEPLPPLLGVPCTVKEVIGVRGLPQTSGLLAREGELAPRDATTVARLRAAGAIVLGVTNMAEGGLWMEARNPLYGHVSNPWDLKRTPGGSSGGCAALVSAGAVPFSLGADIGGSIRIPAAFCGTLGHKPSGRMVPASGHHPLPGPEALGMLCLGPLVSHAEDLLPLLRILAGPDGDDPVVRPFDLSEGEPLDPRQLVVYPELNNGLALVRREARRAVRRAALALGELGATVKPENSLGLGRGVRAWSSVLVTSSSPSYRKLLGDGTPIRVLPQIARRLAGGRGDHTGIPLAICILEKLLGRLPGAERELQRLGEERERLETTLGPRGVILHPPWSGPAPRHRGPMLSPFDWVCTGLFNALEFPGTVVPVGFSSSGMPVAVQVLGQRGADVLTIGAARLLERELGGWVRARPRG